MFILGWDGKESNDTVTWTFAGGLFYSITVITTIGKLYKNTKLPFVMIIVVFQVMVILLPRLLGQKSLQYFTQFWAYLLQYCVGQILEMPWQMPSDFAIGEFVVTFVQRNQKRRKNVIWVEEEEEVVRKWWCSLQKSNAEKKKPGYTCFDE